MSNKELKRVLQEIKDDCRKREDCEGCRFDTDYGCRLGDVPNEWDLIGMHTDKWRTLYSWLVDVRAAIVPDVRQGLKEYTINTARIKLLDNILEYMNELDDEEQDEEEHDEA